MIIWGPSARLLAEKEKLQEKVGTLLKTGVSLTACKWCADEYGVSEELSRLGVEVKYMGKPLTGYLKNNHKVLVF